jgi:hypothetical protein
LDLGFFGHGNESLRIAASRDTQAPKTPPIKGFDAHQPRRCCRVDRRRLSRRAGKGPAEGANRPDMTLIDRYVLRQLVGAFVMVLGVLTGIVWLTSSLRQLDLLVTQGQTLLIFLGVTLLALPLLIALIAPFALFISLVFVLNKLNTDSELIVMSASGLSQARLARPLIGMALAVTALSYAATLVIVPGTLRALR